jgi:hypothetical protein
MCIFKYLDYLLVVFLKINKQNECLIRERLLLSSIQLQLQDAHTILELLALEYHPL